MTKFENTEKFSKGSLCFWSWNDDINTKEIERQLTDFSMGRFSGVVIHSRAGLRVAYLEKEWFRLYRFTANFAKELGMEIWIYDEDGWPSGFAGGRVLALGEKHWAKKLVFSQQLPENKEKIISAWRYTDNGYININVSTAQNGDLICYYAVNSGYVDLLSAETVRSFIDFTHEKYKQELGDFFGNVIKGIFTDEPQLMPLPWSECLDRAWAERYGFDIKPSLYMLYAQTDNWQEFRIKYFELVGELFYNSFSLQISEWCRNNNLILTGHYATEDSLLDQMIANCGVMRHYKSMGMPGIDHLGNRNASPVLMKQASSVANQLGIKNVLSETFGCTGWNISFDELMWIWGRQSALGITKPCFHLSAYSITGRRKRDFPAFFSYQTPWWDSFPKLMKRIDGLNSLMSDGERMVDVLVIAPMTSVKINYNNSRAKYYSCQYRVLLENLLENQLDFELADEAYLSENAYIENGKLCIGNSRYSLVIASDGVCLDKKSALILKTFKDNGGNIWYINNKPNAVDFKENLLPDGILLQNRMKVLEKVILCSDTERPILLKNKENTYLKNGAIIHSRKINKQKRFHIWTDSNFASGKTLVQIKTNNALSGISKIDIAENSEEPLDVFYNGTEICAYIDIKSSDNIVLELKNANTYIKNDVKSEKNIYINNPQISLCEQNAINLDYVSIAFGNEPFGEYKPIIKLTDEIYKRLENEGKEKELKVKYRFCCDDTVVLNDVNIIVESEFATAITVNGTELDIKSDKWWIDRKFFEYSINGLVCVGENEVVVHYSVAPNSKKISENDFETEKNRFFCLVEPESVYIKGDFDVKAPQITENYGNYFRVKNSGFTLTSPTQKHIGDLTKQGMYFYRGDVDYKFDLMYNGEKEVRLFIKNATAVCAEISFNGETKLFGSLADGINIENILRRGCNSVTIRLNGSNRNLLGPHHHIKGISSLTGANTFLGVKGFEDFASPEITQQSTWNDGYTFVNFGCDGFYVSYNEY